MMKERFSPKMLSDITGVSIRTLHYYHEKGLLVPQQMSANGTDIIMFKIFQSYNIFSF